MFIHPSPELATQAVRRKAQASCGPPVVVMEPSEHRLYHDRLCDIGNSRRLPGDLLADSLLASLK